MKIELWLLILYSITVFALGGLTVYVFRQPKTITVTNPSTFVSAPDSTKPKPFIGKPDKILPKVSQPVQNIAVIPPVQNGRDTLIPKPMDDNTPYGEDYGEDKDYESFKTFEDSTGIYFVKALSACGVKEFTFTVTHKPFTMQPVTDCNELKYFTYGTITGAVLIVVFEAVLYFIFK